MCTFVFDMMSRLIAKLIIRSYSMRQRRAAVKPPIGIISNCDVCGGFMFNDRVIPPLRPTTVTTTL